MELPILFFLFKMFFSRFWSCLSLDFPHHTRCGHASVTKHMMVHMYVPMDLTSCGETLLSAHDDADEHVHRFHRSF